MNSVAGVVRSFVAGVVRSRNVFRPLPGVRV